MKTNGARLGEGGERRNRRVASYLAQLRQLVPLVPVDRPVSQLEVIQHVIDYIGQLEQQLERREVPRQQGLKRRQPLQEVTSNTAEELEHQPAAQTGRLYTRQVRCPGHQSVTRTGLSRDWQ